MTNTVQTGEKSTLKALNFLHFSHIIVEYRVTIVVTSAVRVIGSFANKNINMQYYKTSKFQWKLCLIPKMFLGRSFTSRQTPALLKWKILELSTVHDVLFTNVIFRAVRSLILTLVKRTILSDEDVHVMQYN